MVLQGSVIFACFSFVSLWLFSSHPDFPPPPQRHLSPSVLSSPLLTNESRWGFSAADQAACLSELRHRRDRGLLLPHRQHKYTNKYCSSTPRRQVHTVPRILHRLKIWCLSGFIQKIVEEERKKKATNTFKTIKTVKKSKRSAYIFWADKNTKS